MFGHRRAFRPLRRTHGYGFPGGKPEELKQALQDADTFLNILKGVSVVRSVGVRSSDYAPFFQKGAACISFFSNGPHLHYHLTSDTIYRINPDIMADIARLAFLSGVTWSNRADPPHPAR